MGGRQLAGEEIRVNDRWVSFHLDERTVGFGKVAGQERFPCDLGPVRNIRMLDGFTYVM
jgi:hypothetical protein